LLDRLQSEKVTVMVATHDLDQAARHFDRIMLLNHHIIGFGTPDEVLQTEKLLRAYGGRLRNVNNGAVLTVEDCCDEGEPNHVH